jgi:hypothetical protein
MLEIDFVYMASDEFEIEYLHHRVLIRSNVNVAGQQIWPPASVLEDDFK